MKFSEASLARFWAKVDRSGECWLWIASKTRQGYGKIRINKADYRAHRVSFLISKGDIPDGLFVCHSCDNTSCVRPDHLFLGDHQENMLDMKRKHRQAIGARTGRYTCPDRTARGERHRSVTSPETLPRGEGHVEHKCSDEEIRLMRDEYLAGGISQTILGCKYGISQGQVSRIVRQVGRKTAWEHANA